MIEHSKGNWRDIEFSGSLASLLKRPDTFIQRHEEKSLFIWRWVKDNNKTVAIEVSLHPVLSHSRSALYVYRSMVNRVIYRKPHHKVSIHSNGISRQGMSRKCKTNYCPFCKGYVNQNHEH